MKTLITILCLCFALTANAQKVEKDGKQYEVKKDKIFLNGEDVTEAISVEDRAAIFGRAKAIKAEIEAKEAKEKAQKKKEKELKKAEKAQKKAEKEAKKAAKALKKKEKAQKNFSKATNNLEKAQKKYEKLKNRGKLSPVDEKKWLEKIEKLSEKVAKAKKKM